MREKNNLFYTLRNEWFYYSLAAQSQRGSVFARNALMETLVLYDYIVCFP